MKSEMQILHFYLSVILIFSHHAENQDMEDLRALRDAGVEITPYLFESLCSSADDVFEGFAAQITEGVPYSLENSVGKSALVGMLRLAHFVARSIKGNIGKVKIRPNGHGLHDPGVILNTYRINAQQQEEFMRYVAERRQWQPLEGSRQLLPPEGRRKVQEEAAAKREESRQWLPPSSKASRRKQFPDVICCIKKDGSPHAVRQVLTCQVKSSSHMTCITQYHKHNKLFRQSWKQSLLGLIGSDSTYGLSLHPNGADLFRMEIGAETNKYSPATKVLNTFKENFSFLEDRCFQKGFLFDVDQLIMLQKRLITIFIQIPDLERQTEKSS